MIRTTTTLVSMFALMGAISCGVGTTPKMVSGVAVPAMAADLISQQWKSWSLATTDPQAIACRTSGDAPGAMVQGDFDGDGRPDVALAVKTPQGVRLVAVLSRLEDGRLFDVNALGDAQATAALGVARRGSSYRNPLADLDEYFATDTPTTERCGQPGRTAYFWNGAGFTKQALAGSTPGSQK